jgi:hypothetical protein
MQATIKLFKSTPGTHVYKAGVVSRLGDRTFFVHDSNGAPHFMRLHDNERTFELNHCNIPTNEGNVLTVEGIMHPYPAVFGGTNILLDHRLRIKWIPSNRISSSTALDGTCMDARGYRYFASTRAATEWLIAYLSPICDLANTYLSESKTIRQMETEDNENKMAKLYAAANGDNYGDEYDVPALNRGPNTWWSNLSESEKYSIFQQHGGDK